MVMVAVILILIFAMVVMTFFGRDKRGFNKKRNT